VARGVGSNNAGRFTPLKAGIAPLMTGKPLFRIVVLATVHDLTGKPEYHFSGSCLYWWSAI
jgi:hypothetical protein